MSTLVTTNLKHAGSATPNLTLNSDGTFNIGDAKVVTPTGTAPIYQCRAWVNFNGTGTVAIRASGNVSSITDGGTGVYTVNLTTAMPDANYACNASSTGRETIPSAPTTSSVSVACRNSSGTLTDEEYVFVSFFR